MLALLNVLAVLASSSPMPDPPNRGPWLAIRPAEYVNVQIRPDGGWRVIERGPASGPALPLNPAHRPVVPPDTVRFTLNRTDRGMMLVVINGYGQRLQYRGLLRRQPNSRPEPSSVCPVLGRIMGVEDWPYAFAELDVGEFELVQDAGQPMVCR